MTVPAMTQRKSLTPSSLNRTDLEIIIGSESISGRNIFLQPVRGKETYFLPCASAGSDSSGSLTVLLVRNRKKSGALLSFFYYVSFFHHAECKTDNAIVLIVLNILYKSVVEIYVE